MSHSKFDEIMRQMGESIKRMSNNITPITFTPSPISKPIHIDIGALGTRAGVEINIEDIKLTGDGIFSYYGKAVLLFIPDHGNKLPEKLAGNIEGNKFHLTDCSTLQHMRQIKKYNRYFATDNTEGIFEIFGINHDGTEQRADVELFVCKNCLHTLNYQHYAERYQKHHIYINFRLDEFFEIFTSSISYLPDDVGQNTGSNYVKNWHEISQNFRANKNWTCEQCGVNLSGYRALLHVHHIDGVKRNNSLTNLRALCLECHSQQPMHEHMTRPASYQNNINRLRDLRQQQGLQ